MCVTHIFLVLFCGAKDVSGVLALSTSLWHSSYQSAEKLYRLS